MGRVQQDFIPQAKQQQRELVRSSSSDCYLSAGVINAQIRLGTTHPSSLEDASQLALEELLPAMRILTRQVTFCCAQVKGDHAWQAVAVALKTLSGTECTCNLEVALQICAQTSISSCECVFQ